MSENTSIKELAAQIMPCDKSKPYAFVSYSKRDYAKVYPCIIALQQTGCNIWVDKNMEAQADHSWTELAFEAIQNKNCVAVIFMISSNSLISVPCFNEILYSQKGQLTLNRHRNNPVKLITVNTDTVWDPRRTHFSQWIYDESDKYNDDSLHNLSTADKTLLVDLGGMIEPGKAFNIPTSGDVATAFMNEVYGGAKEIDRTTVLPIDSIGAILKNITETMDKPEVPVNPPPAPSPVPSPAPTAEPEKVTVPPSEPIQPSAPVQASAPFQASAPVQTSAPVQSYAPVQQSKTANFKFDIHDKKFRIILIAAGVVAALIILLVIILNIGAKTVTNVQYTTRTGSSGTYTGKWLNDMPYEYGVMVFEGGSVYEGEWKDGQPNGQGKITYSDGHTYEGEWLDDSCNGQGKYTFRDENGKVTAVYEGEFKDDSYNGQGTYTLYENEKVTSIYKGEFKDDLMNGQGIITAYDENGKVTAVYDGEFKDGTIYIPGSVYTEYDENGNVTCIEYDENGDVDSVYKGEFANGKKNGQGTLTAANGYVYNGEWADDKQNGEGTEDFENGDHYEGLFLDGLKFGQGTFTFSDGRVYTGGWKDNEPYGYGRLTDSQGNLITQGEWNGWG